jgi:hypothetical protein
MVKEPQKNASERSSSLWEKFESAAKISLEKKDSNFEGFFQQKLQLFTESG